MKGWVTVIATVGLLAVATASPAAVVDISASVPSYIWYNGCGPTALGMMIGYWDANGFPNLIPGSNNWNTNQQAIKDAIASPGHIADYVPTPDRVPPPPYHADDSIADFSHTSRNPQQWGWSYFSDQDNGLTGYASFRGYHNDTVSQSYFGGTLWSDVVSAINAGHPAEFLVDSDGNGDTDHFITVVGYDDNPNARRYGFYDTWDHDVDWELYHEMKSGDSWGVYGGTFFSMSGEVPEPSTLIVWSLLGASGVGIGGWRRRRRAA